MGDFWLTGNSFLFFESARKDEVVLPRAIELGTLLEQDELMKNLTLIQRTSTR